MNKQQGEHIAFGEIFINYPHSDEIKRPCSHLLLNIALIFPLRGINTLEPVEMLYYDLSICMYICRSIYISRYIYLSMSVHLSIHSANCLLVCHISLCLSVSLSLFCLSCCLFVCLSGCQSAYPQKAEIHRP